jgi:DNA-binding transcriptional ArsR family regulator
MGLFGTILNRMVNYPHVEDVFAALGDPTRRRIVERLARGSLTVGEIAAEFPMSAPAITKHLKVLERHNVIQRRVRGRVHHCSLRPRTIRSAGSWIEAQERFWNAAFDRLDEELATTSNGENNS